MRFHRLRVGSVDRLCDDAAAVTFEVPDDLVPDFRFAAGQSLTLRREIDGVEQRRSYSICAAVGEPLRIGVREIAGGLFSSWLVHEVRPGDEVEVSTPTGSWQANPAVGARYLCIAAGSGITPMLSVASTVLTHPEAQVSLLYGNRASGSVMFAEELGDLKNAYGSRFQLVHVLSREPSGVDLLSGRLDENRLRRLLTEVVLVETFDQVWLCGPLDLVSCCRKVLASLGVAAEKIHVELFYVDALPPRPSVGVPAGVTSELTTVLDGQRVTVRASRETSVLESAQSARSDLPYACKGGVCGTCRAVVRSGEVDMRRNYALETAELKAGFVLTCQSFPLSDALMVDFDA